jgi:hypothetical protein
VLGILIAITDVRLRTREYSWTTGVAFDRLQE